MPYGSSLLQDVSSTMHSAALPSRTTACEAIREYCYEQGGCSATELAATLWQCIAYINLAYK